MYGDAADVFVDNDRDGWTDDVNRDGVPDVVHAGQGGFGDVIAAPDFASTSKTNTTRALPAKVFLELR